MPDGALTEMYIQPSPNTTRASLGCWLYTIACKILSPNINTNRNGPRPLMARYIAFLSGFTMKQRSLPESDVRKRDLDVDTKQDGHVV